jgi:hypothetical protein
MPATSANQPIKVRPGKKLVEVTATEKNKGAALVFAAYHPQFICVHLRLRFGFVTTPKADAITAKALIGGRRCPKPRLGLLWE